MGRYFVADRLSVRCHRCGQVGHRVQECTNAALAHPCFMCGGINHEAYRCPDQLCHRCNRPGHTARNCREEPAPRTGVDRYGHWEMPTPAVEAARDRMEKVLCLRCGEAGHVCCGFEQPEAARAPLYCARCGRQGHLYGECDGGRGGRSSGGPARARRRGTHQRFDSSDDSTVDGRDMRAKGARAAPARRHSSPRGGARPKPGVWGGNDGAEVTYVGASDSESGTSPEAGTGAGADPDPYASSSDEGGTGFFVQEERPHPSRGRGRGRGNRPAGAGGRGRGRGGGRGRQDRRGGGPDRRGSPGQPRRRSHHGSGQGGPATGGRGRGRGGGRSSGGGEDRSSRKRWRQSSSDADRSSRKRGGGGRG